MGKKKKERKKKDATFDPQECPVSVNGRIIVYGFRLLKKMSVRLDGYLWKQKSKPTLIGSQYNKRLEQRRKKSVNSLKV